MNLCVESIASLKPMETVDDSIDPELEVQKLQDLVRKLERQNEILRNKQQEQIQNSQNNQEQLTISDIENVNSEKPVTKPKIKYSIGREHGLQKYKDTLDSILEPSAEDLGILEVDLSSMSDNEESWLYQSPKALTQKQKSTSPYKWVREVFDGAPSAELESVRKCLVFKLDEVTKGGRVSRSSSSHTLASPNSPVSAPSTAIGEPPQSNNNNNTINNPGVPTIKPPLIAGLGTRVNTDTFTRPKKNKELKNYEYDDPLPLESNDVSPPSLPGYDRKTNNLAQSLQQTPSTQLQPSKKTLDVHALAKMQEESLRQSFSPLTSPRRSKGRKKGGFYLNQPNDSDSNISPSSQSSTRSSPSRQDADNMIPSLRKMSSASHASSTASLNSNGSNGSHGSTPPDSPYGSTQYLEMSPQGQLPRRSLPNLKGLMNGMRPNASEPQLSLHRERPNSPRLSNTGRASPQLRAPSSGRTSPAGRKSPSALRQPSPVQRSTSPTQKSNIPMTGRTGIPRPGNTTPRSSGIPMARSVAMTPSRERSVSPDVRGRSSSGNRQVGMSSLPVTGIRGNRNYAVKTADDSWKEGCF